MEKELNQDWPHIAVAIAGRNLITGHMIFDRVTVDFGGSGWSAGRDWGWDGGSGGWWWVFHGGTQMAGEMLLSAPFNCVYHDWVHQWSWRWYRVMVHWMHHRGDDSDAIVIISDVPVCGHRPK
jgi:hypothetical protein